MFNLRDIIEKNNSTFYNFDSDAKISQVRRVMTMLISAFLLAILCSYPSDVLLAAFLAVQTILLGFTFNVMFFLLSNPEKGIRSRSGILEDEIRVDNLVKLYREIFYNVSYFNVISVGSIIIAAFLLVPSPSVPSFMDGIGYVGKLVHWMNTSPLWGTAKSVCRGSIVFIFYAISIEVIYSILRIVGRTTFYFEKKLNRKPHADTNVL